MRGLIRRILACLSESVRGGLVRRRHPWFAYALFLPARPISSQFGWDRGTPVDRFFIERFLEGNRQYIRGECLEVKNADYVHRFGQQLTRVDVLDLDRNNSKATIYGDLRRLESVPDDIYQCFILTQVFQYIDDLDAAVRETYRVLKPGGTALVTLPAILRGVAHEVTYWLFTTASAKHLFGRYFPDDHLEVQSRGNAITGMACWLGLAQEDLRRGHLEGDDPDFPCTITVRATKPLAYRSVGPQAALAPTARTT